MARIGNKTDGSPWHQEAPFQEPYPVQSSKTMSASKIIPR